jgi:hypothetical protein
MARLKKRRVLGEGVRAASRGDLTAGHTWENIEFPNRLHCGRNGRSSPREFLFPIPRSCAAV